MQRLRYSKLKAVAVTLGLSALSVVVLVLAAGMRPGTPTTVIQNVATVTLTLGLVGLLYELLLREAVMKESIELIGLRETIEATGLRELSKQSVYSTHEYLRSSRNLRVLLVNPLAWVQRDWHHVLDGVKVVRARLEIYLPDPEGPAIGIIAERLGFDRSFFQSQVASARQILEDGWKAAQVEVPSLKQGSKISLHFYSQVPSYGIIEGDETVTISVPTSLDSQATDDAMILVFRRRPPSFPSSWLEQQLNRMSLPADFENEV